MSANLFRNAKGALEQTMKIRSGAAVRARTFVCFFRLSQNLGLTDNHGIDTRGHPEKMQDTIGPFVVVKGRCIDGKSITRETMRNLLSR